MPDTTPTQLAKRLEARIPVLAADPIPADISPRDRAEVEIVLRREWETLPERIAEVIYESDFAPAVVGHRAPEHRHVVAVRR